MSDEINVPEHYIKFVREIEPHIERLRHSLKTPPPFGEPLDELSHARILLDGIALKRLSDAVTSFGVHIFAVEVVSESTIKAEASAFGEAIRGYLANFDTLRSRPFPFEFEDGHPLLVATVRRPLLQLLEAVETVQELVLRPADFRAKHGSLNINLQIKFNITQELAAWESWVATIKSQLNQIDNCCSTNKSNCSSKASSWFWGLLGAYALNEIFFDRH